MALKKLMNNIPLVNKESSHYTTEITSLLEDLLEMKDKTSETSTIYTDDELRELCGNPKRASISLKEDSPLRIITHEFCMLYSSRGQFQFPLVFVYL